MHRLYGRRARTQQWLINTKYDEEVDGAAVTDALRHTHAVAISALAVDAPLRRNCRTARVHHHRYVKAQTTLAIIQQQLFFSAISGTRHSICHAL
eukprot:2006490-Pleurochrysis_carterae.AAC.1